MHLNAIIRGEISKLYKCIHKKTVQKLFKIMFVYVYGLSMANICINVCVCVVCVTVKEEWLI